MEEFKNCDICIVEIMVNWFFLEEYSSTYASLNYCDSYNDDTYMTKCHNLI